MRWLLAWCAIPLFGQATAPIQPPPASGADLLPKIREKMIENLQAQPNYTCTETIERLYRYDRVREFVLQDTVRVEVALVDGDELFAPPGAKKFENVTLQQITGGAGAISNGDFALHARGIFGGFATEFEYKGEEQGRVRFDYQVPRAKSDLTLLHGDVKYQAGYHGGVEANRETLDVERIEVMVDQVPPALKMKHLAKDLNFARIKIGEGTFLLPAQSELTITNADNSENRNRTRFTSCRQFTGESTLSFDDPAPSAAPAAAPARVVEVKLPADLDVKLTLEQAIDTKTATVGEQIRASVTSDVLAQSGVIIPKGATALGRLTQAERRAGLFLIGIEFDELEWAGGHALFHAGLARIDNPAGASAMRIAVPRLANEGLISLSKRQTGLPRGLVMIWSTVP